MKFGKFISLFCLCLALCLLLLPTKAEAASTNDLTFTLNADGKSYAVTDCESSASGSLVIPAAYNGKPVITIGNRAFSDCTSLTSVTIPDSVTSIERSAFSWCTSLTSITIPDSVTTIGESAFLLCTSLTDVYITDPNAWCKIAFGNNYSNPMRYGDYLHILDANGKEVTDIILDDTVTAIPAYAFSWCTSLTSITIPDSVTTIGEEAFRNCSNLTDVYITDPNAWCKIAFGNNYSNPMYNGDHLHILDENGKEVTDIVLDDSVTAIPDYAFRGCTSLTSITIPDSVTTVGRYAFLLCTSLTSVTIGNGVTTIGASAFIYCDSLRSITIPDSVTTIGDDAFTGCSSLQYNTYDNGKCLGNPENPYLVLVSIVSSGITVCDIHKDTKIIAGAAFSSCYSLASITIPDSVTTIGDYAFSYCTSLTSVTIPDSVTTIGDYAFSACSSLTTITIPDSVTTIGGSAFSYCTSLTSVTIPDSVTTIEYSAFYDCDNLTSVTIPDSVKYVDDFAFYDCKALIDIWYVGSENDRSSITILSGNQYLENAVWHYNCCSPSAHSYDNACDTVCNICGFERAVLDHIYTNSCDTTCDECGAVRSIIHTYDNACDAVCNICGFERAVPDHIYTNSCDTKCNICSAERSITHTFDNDCDTVCNICSYQRKVAHFYDDADDVICNLCTLPRTPAIPEMVYVTDSTVTLVAIAGYEYSKNGTNWQNSNIFTGLQPNTSYKFYQRVAASAINLVSAASLPLSVTTNKHMPDIPEDFTFLEITDTSVRLNEVPGCEYSMDGIYWQTSPVFTGLTPSTQYTFYQRVAEDNKNYASGKVALQITTRSKLGTVTYDPNGGENAPESTTGIISKQKPTRSEYVFLGWALKPNTYAVYKPGDSYSQQEDVILYAVWLQECLECHGDMKVYKVCSSCKGTGVRIEIEKCSSCGGDGSTYSKEPCPVDYCYSGTLIFNGQYIGKCSSCGGDGVFELPTDCSSCKGKGKIINEYTCRNCAGEEAWLVDCSNCTTGFRPCTPETPEAPQLQNVSNQTVVLAYYSTCEYSCNGVNWQSSNIFTNLSPNTTYVFYQRYKATAYNDSSNASPALRVTTLKESTLTPQPPVLQSKTYNKVVLEKADGCEYSMDGVNWQTSNVFDNLFPSTSYTFYCRFAESNTHLYSNVSDGLEVVTAEFRLYTVVFQNWDGTILSSNTYYWGDPVAVPEDPAVPDALGEKYVFSGWDKKIVPCSGDATYTAVFKIQSPGDIDCNKAVTTDDVVALLLYISMPDMFPLGEGVNADFTGDGLVTTDDAVQLLLHISMPDVFPLEPRKKD